MSRVTFFLQYFVCVQRRLRSICHPRSLIRVFAVRLKTLWILRYSQSAPKQLIRLRGFAGWSESSPDAYLLVVLTNDIKSIPWYWTATEFLSSDPWLLPSTSLNSTVLFVSIVGVHLFIIVPKFKTFSLCIGTDTSIVNIRRIIKITAKIVKLIKYFFFRKFHIVIRFLSPK